MNSLNLALAMLELSIRILSMLAGIKHSIVFPFPLSLSAHATFYLQLGFTQKASI